MFPKYLKRSLHMTRYNHTELCVTERKRERERDVFYCVVNFRVLFSPSLSLFSSMSLYYKRNTGIMLIL
jgi:hypothetical protein